MSNHEPFFWQPTWQQDSVEIKEDHLVYDGFYPHKRLVARHKCFSGEWSPWLVREQILMRHAAAVILWEKSQDKLVLVEQIRFGLVGPQNKTSPWMLEVVAGLCDEGETPEETVLREAKEEAGCEIITLKQIGEYYNTPGGCAEKSSVYCGIIDKLPNDNDFGVKNDKEHEDIRVHVVSAKAVLAAFDKGQLMTSASTFIALQWFKNYG